MKSGLLFLLVSLFPFAAIAQGKGDCDVITLKNGALIYGKVIAVKKGKILYKECGDNSGKQEQVPSDSATMINHPDGSYQMLHGHSSFGNESSNEGNAAFIALEGGVGIPVGSFGSTSSVFYSISNAGFATTGFGADAYGTFFLNNSRNFGVSLLAGYAYNGFNFNAYFNSLNSYYTYLGESVSLLNYQSSFYHNLRILLGPTVSASLGEKFNLDFSFLVGAYINGYSGTSFTYTISNSYQAFTYSQNLSGGNLLLFGGELRAGARFHVSDKICLLLNGSFFISFESSSLLYYNYTAPYASLDFFRTSLVNASTGLAYQLGK